MSTRKLLKKIVSNVSDILRGRFFASKKSARWKNLRLRDKIILYCFLIYIIPLALITTANFRISIASSKEAMTDFIKLFLTQLSGEIESFAESVDNASKIVVNDYNMLRFLSSEEGYLISERVKYRSLIDGYIYNMALQKPEVEMIVIIGNSKVVYHNTGLDKILHAGDLEKQDWYQKILRRSDGSLVVVPFESARPGDGGQIGGEGEKQIGGDGEGQISEKGEEQGGEPSFILGRVLKDQYGVTHGLIAFKARFDRIIKTSRVSNRIVSEYDIGIIVANSDGERIYSFPTAMPEYMRKFEKNTINNNETSPDGAGKGVLIIKNISPKYKFETTFFVPEKTLFYRIYVLRNITFAFVMLIILLTVTLSLLLAHGITGPIARLVRSMKLFQAQKYDYIEDAGRADEIGILTKTYNRMISEINRLINEVYVAKLMEKQAQYAALQHQINPHMLYNTIENIRMHAVLNNDFQVSEMIKDLGNLFHHMLSKDKTNHTIRDEVEYVGAYINLLNIRHENRYVLKCGIPDEVMDARIIKFAFQPIVENSIVHGFKNKEENCVIEITAKIAKGGDVGSVWNGDVRDALKNEAARKDVLIRISDNGEGMDEERLREIKEKFGSPVDMTLDAKSSIGIKNVYDRIKLEYGEAYCLDVKSERFKGTTVEIRIPFRTYPKGGGGESCL